MDIISAFTTGVTAVKGAIEVMKGAKELFPPGSEKATLEMKIAEAEKALQLAEVQIAESLGYPLCKCDFPPKIMLSVGGSTVQGLESVEVFKCPSCERVISTEKELVAMNQQKEKSMQRAKGYSVQ